MGMPPFNQHDKIFDPPGTGSTGYLPFPLAVVIIGGHEPQWVEDVLARVGELDQQELNDIDALNLLTEFMIFVAWDEVGRN